MDWRLYGRPSDGSGGPPEAGAAATENQEAREAEVPAVEETPDPVVQLQSELAAAQSEKAEWHDRLLRKAAEFDNYRKRSEKEKAEAAVFSKRAVLLELLPVLDACERAQESFSEAVEGGDLLLRYRQGVDLLYKQLSDTLTKLGVVPFEAHGERFDPNLHEALIREENSDYPEDTVMGVLRRGYRYKDRLLRPAQVKVAVRSGQ